MKEGNFEDSIGAAKITMGKVKSWEDLSAATMAKLTEMEQQGKVIDTQYGKVVVNENNELPTVSSAAYVKYDGIINFSPDKSFAVTFKEKDLDEQALRQKLGDKFQGEIIRGKMWIYNDKDPLKLSLGEIIEAIGGSRSVESEWFAAKELEELGIEAKPEHIKAVLEMRNASNFPDGYDDIIKSLHDSEKLKVAMEARGIKLIIHAEGATVWEHVKTVIRQIDILDVSDDLKKDMRLIMLYHDIGKVEVGSSVENTARTKKHLEKGELHTSMVGHAEARADEMRAGLTSAGVEGRRLEQLMTVIKYHMNTSIPEQDPKKTVKIVQSFGETDEERNEVVNLLAMALYVDGNGTHHAEFKDGELKITKNEKGLGLTGELIWQKYQEGLKLIQSEQEALQKKKEQEDSIISILGTKLSDYLQAKGIKPGPEMGKRVKQLQQIISDSSDKTPEEIKAIVDNQLP